MKKVTLSLLLIATAFTLPLAAQQRQYLHEGWTFGQTRLPNRYPAELKARLHLRSLCELER